MRLWRYPIPFLIIAGMLVHACALLAVHHRTGAIDGYALRSLDSAEYLTLAGNIAKHGVFSQSDQPPFHPDTWRTPGYPIMLAGCLWIVSESPAALVVVQQGLSILNVVLLFLIARRWMSARRATMLALVFLIEPYHLLYSTWLMAGTWFVTVLLLLWIAWERGLARASWWWVAVAGALSGYLVLVRPVALLIPIVLGAMLIERCVLRSKAASPDARSLRVWAGAGAFALACLLVIGSWMARNHQVAGRFALSHQGGVVLAYFKSAEVTLWSQGRAADRYMETTLDPARADQPHAVWDSIDERLRDRLARLTTTPSVLNWRNLAQGNETPVDSFVISDALAAIGWSDLWTSPLSTVACCVVRCGSLLTFPLNLAIAPPTGVKVNRIVSLAKSLPYMALVVVLLIRLGRRRIGWVNVCFPLGCAVALLIATAPQIDPRFRVPLIPLLLVVALMPLANRGEPQGDPDDTLVNLTAARTNVRDITETTPRCPRPVPPVFRHPRSPRHRDGGAPAEEATSAGGRRGWASR